MSDGHLRTLGDRLAWALKNASITQSQLAEAIGGTQAAVSQWCSGKKIPSDESIDAIVQALGLNGEWLKSGTGPVRPVNEAAQRAEYTEAAFWGFRSAPRDGGRDFGNANVWSFDPTVEVLVREVLQNALDAALPGDSEVSVKFRIIELKGRDLNEYLEAIKWSDLKQHLDKSADNGQKLGSLIRDGLDYLEKSQELLLLVIEDSGTTGLLGPETGDGKFAALCRNNLDSNKEGAHTKGGAFGLGKGVLWRASRFATVMFCSNLSQLMDGRYRNLRILGRCDLPWHKLLSASFAGPGWFGRANSEDPEYAVSFWENDALARDLYLARDSAGSGTSACVVGFHDPSSDKPKSARELSAEIEKAAAQHFFPAMSTGKLRVSVETYSGRSEYDDASPSSSVEVDVAQLQPEFSHILQVFREGAFADALNTPGDVVYQRVALTVPARKILPKHGECEHGALLLVRYATEPEDSEARKRLNKLAKFRGPGMVVESKDHSGICLGSRPFHALLLAGVAASEEPQPADLAAEEFLRTAEPPSHNKWIATPELKAAYDRGCVSKLDAFLDSVKETLRDIVKPVSRDLGDGPNSLRELFRIGTEPIMVTRERPRIVEQHGTVDAEGRWNVEARIRLKSTDRETLITPVVLFVAETGGGQAVRWEQLEAVSNCNVKDPKLRIPPHRREAVFRGVTDPASHPVPAHDSSIVVDIRKVIQRAGGEA